MDITKKTLIALIAILTVILVVLIAVYLNQAKIPRTQPKNVSPQALKATEWYARPTPEAFSLRFFQDEKGNLIVDKIKKEKKWPSARNKNPPKLHYKIDMFDKNGKVIYTNYLPKYNVVFSDDFSGKEVRGSMEISPIQNFDLVLPAENEAVSIKITDNESNLIKELDIKK